MENESLEEQLRNEIRSDIIRRNQLRGPINYEAERMLEKCVELELGDRADGRKYRPSYRAWGDDE